MRTATIIVCLLFVCGILAQTSAPTGNYCSKFVSKCVNNGAQCTTGFFGNYDSSSDTYTSLDCSNGQYCKPSTSDSTSGTCTSTVAGGQACNVGNGDVCAVGFLCNATASSPTCTQIQIVGAGQTCGAFAVCQNNLFCNGTVNGPQCAGVTANGGDCTNTQSCLPGSFCQSNKCITSFSLNNGDSCVDDYECGVGFSCVALKCASVAASSNKACMNSSDYTACNTGEGCVPYKCTGKTPVYHCESGSANTDGEKKVATNFWNCQNSHTSDVCTYSIGATNSCKNCKSQACAFGTLSFKHCSFGDCSSAASLVASFVLLVAALFVAM